MWEILNHLKIRVRLYLFFTMSVLLFVAFGWFALYNLDSISNSVELIKRNPMTVSNHVAEASEIVIKMHRAMKDYILADTPDSRRIYLEKINVHESEVSVHLDSIGELIIGEAGRKLLSKTRRNFTSWRDLRQETIALAGEGDLVGAKAITTGKEARHVLLLEVNFNALKVYAQTKADSFVKDARDSHSNSRMVLIGGIIVVALTFWLAAWFVSSSIVNPLRTMSNHIKKLANGVHPETSSMKGKDELVAMNESITDMVKGLKNTADFALKIGEGRLDADFKVLSEGDVLGNSLLEMRKKLKLFSEEEQQRHWVSSGLAAMSDQLRKNQNSLQVLGENLLAVLVPFIGAHQGALFILEELDGEDQLSLLSGYAQNDSHVKFKIVKLGEGLVGQAAIEDELIHLKTVPKDFFKISSGLGESSPREIILSPLKINDQLIGVLELSTLNQFEPHHIAFVHQLAESIATTISGMQTNHRTKELLQKTKNINEQVVTQEEKLRENAETIQLNQEDMKRQLKEKDARIVQLKEKLASYESNDEG